MEHTNIASPQSQINGESRMTAAMPFPARFYSLDVLRGLAALSTLFWHWQHFFYFAGQPASSFAVDQQPLFKIFFVFYSKGSFAVDLFFCLSGFIFYWLYSSRISHRETSAKQFFVLRFSRLYPLHLLTLLWVAGLQIPFTHISNTYFVYPYNDTYHFFLNLFFVSSWGFEKGNSFNAPIWSVSIDVWLYVLFFLLCRLLPVRTIVLTGSSLIGFWCIIYWGYSPMSRGLASFFSGGCVYLAYAWIVRTHRTQQVLKWLPPLVATIWILTAVGIRNEWTIGSLRFFWRFERLIAIYPVAVLFPLTILILALVETQRGSLGGRISFLGDISYSVYLMQFPLQLTIIIIFTWIGLERTLFYSPYMLGSFFAILLAVSFVSFRYLERPAQRYIRKCGLTKASSLHL